VAAIIQRIEEMHHPITYVKIPRELNQADGPAREARLREELPVHKIEHKTENDYQLTYEGVRTNVYPSRLIKKYRQIMLANKNNRKVGIYGVTLFAPELTTPSHLKPCK
jgi:hypothetical protein